MERIAIFPGSFDPFTKGHFNIVNRGLRFFDHIIISIGINPKKQRYFPAEQMEKYIKEAFKDHERVSVRTYQGLTAAFAAQVGAQYMLRGLRNSTDYEYENSIAQANQHINPDLETVFLINSPGLAYISSSFVRELHSFGQNVDAFLPFKIES